jgi:hypothetical protein
MDVEGDLSHAEVEEDRRQDGKVVGRPKQGFCRGGQQNRRDPRQPRDAAVRHEVEAVARVTKIATKCIHGQSCLRSTYTRTKLAEQK